MIIEMEEALLVTSWRESVRSSAKTEGRFLKEAEVAKYKQCRS